MQASGVLANVPVADIEAARGFYTEYPPWGTRTLLSARSKGPDANTDADHHEDDDGHDDSLGVHGSPWVMMFFQSWSLACVR